MHSKQLHSFDGALRTYLFICDADVVYVYIECVYIRRLNGTS